MSDQNAVVASSNGASNVETLADQPTPPRRRFGFAAMDRTRVRELASKGGIAAHLVGTAHKFTPEEARIAGRKGGLARSTPRADKPGPA